MKYFTQFLLLIISLSFLSCGSQSEFNDTPWQAQWIGTENASQQNSWIAFRKSIDLQEIPESGVARIACDSKYWLWVNDELVVFEGQLKRGPTPEDTYYDLVDFSDHLTAGENSVALLVWYWGKHGFSHNSSWKAGLIFDGSIDGEPVLSDSTWKVSIHPAYGSTGEPHPNYRLPEANILFDARQDMPGWTGRDFDDSGWRQAEEYGQPPVAPWNNLEERPIPFWKDSGLIDYTNADDISEQGTGSEIICTLPYNAQVTPYLKIDAPAGQQIEIKTDNYRGGGPPNVRAVYITREGVQEYEFPGWMNGHDVRYTIPEGVEILELKYRETGYNADVVGSFTSDDEDMNILWQKSLRTLYITMRDTYMDCPDRERAQWWGDAVNELGEAFYVFDFQRGPLLAKKGIYELARWQRPDSTLYSPVPAGHPDNLAPGADEPTDGTWYRELPRQMLASIGWYGFWTYYWYTGDRETIADVYPAVKKYLGVWELGDDGLVIHRTGEWDWTDWGEEKDVPVLENAWYYLALKAAVEMARLTGNDSDIPGYEDQMQSIEENFNSRFWQGNRYHSPSHTGETDDRANAMAVVAGLAEPDYYPAIRNVLKYEYHASPYMEKYVLESLYMMHAPEQAMERMKNRYRVQIDSELTTLWEGWGLGPDGYGGGTYNHAWSGGPLTMLSQYAAGIEPTSPAFETFQVLPRPGSLQQISAEVPAKYGLISLDLQQTGNSLTMDVTVPENSSAVVGIPKSQFAGEDISVNGENIWHQGDGVEVENAVKFTGEDERWVRFTVTAGEWNFAAE
jgi:hypothetical protein